MNAAAGGRRGEAPVLRYIALALVLAAALVYQVRYTIYRFPAWFGRQVVQYPFTIFSPDADRPELSIYAFRDTHIPGIHNGDEVLAVNGKPMTGTAVFGEAIAKSKPGGSITVTLRADHGAARTVTVPLKAAPPIRLDSFSSWADLLLLAILPWFCFVLGFWVVAVRIHDLRAWLLLALMLSFAAYLSPGTESWEPWLRDYGVAYHRIASDFLPIGLLLLGIYFPEPFPPEGRWARWMWLKWIIIVPLALAAVCDVITFIGGMENYAAVFFVQKEVMRPFAGLFSLLDLTAVIGMLVCLAAKFRLATSPDAKRRLRVLVAGALVSVLPVLTVIIVAHLLDVSIDQYFPIWVWFPPWLLFFLFPVTLAYLIVVHRAMGVRVVIRQSLQYALAQRGVRVLRVLLGIAIVAAMLSLLHRFGRTVLFYVILAIGIAIWIGLRRLLGTFGGWVDRQFFRETYNAEQLLAELSETVRSIVETQPLLATVSERISRSLHVPRIAVLIDGSSPYRPAYALGYDPAPDVLFPDDGPTVRQLREEMQAARVYFDDPNSWIYKRPDMTEEERARLAALEPELLLPLARKEKLLGFISLGHKRSEEPYSPSDLRLLESVATQTGLALEVARLTTAISEEIAQRERLNRELEIAREVQERLFPQQPPRVAGLDYCGACRPALGVGGDYYDFLSLAGGQLGIALGDVSGKGIAAALMMASLQASLRAEASRGVEDLGAMIGRVNRLLYEASTQNRYATFFYGQYDPAGRKLSYVNAGHNAPMLFKNSRSGGDVVRLEAGGMVIGLLPSACYQDATVALEEGDVLVLYTDGITETMNANEEEWGEANLIRTLEESKHLSAREMLARIMECADAFAAGAEQHDDMTLVVLRVTLES